MKLSNKASLVLEILRDKGSLKTWEVVAEVHQRMPCPYCEGTGECRMPECWADHRCPKCYGHGHILFGYSDAYVALKQLEKRGLVSHRRLVDEWGDVMRTLIWFVTDALDPTDELEQLFALPAVERE